MLWLPSPNQVATQYIFEKQFFRVGVYRLPVKNNHNNYADEAYA